MCLFLFFLQYSRWLNHASFWHTDVTSVKIACTLFLFLSTILLTSSFFYQFWPGVLLHRVVDPHWTIGIVSQNCNWGIRGLCRLGPEIVSVVVVILLILFLLLVIFAAVFTSPQTSMIVNCPDPSTDWQRCFASALQGGGGGELCQRQRGRTMFGQSNPSSSAGAGGGRIFLEIGFLNIYSFNKLYPSQFMGVFVPVLQINRKFCQPVSFSFWCLTSKY